MSGTGSNRRLIGESVRFQASVARLRRLAPSPVPILILGETGTGKELAARLVHRESGLPGPLVPMNCAAVSESLVLSDLFGHSRGAFTGAHRDRPGIFESARRGTVFLDEIGDLPAAAQGMLLRVLQEGEVRRLGESRPRRVDVRVVAATHRDLQALVDRGEFRRDLFFRLAAGRVKLPALRDRSHDVILLAEHFLSRNPGQRRSRLATEAREALRRHPWPGNVRELQNVLSVAATLADSGEIRSEHLELPESHGRLSGGYHDQLDLLRRRLVEEALTATGGNRSRAARRLGLSRQSLYSLIRRLDICPPEVPGK